MLTLYTSDAFAAGVASFTVQLVTPRTAGLRTTLALQHRPGTAKAFGSRQNLSGGRFGHPSVQSRYRVRLGMMLGFILVLLSSTRTTMSMTGVAFRSQRLYTAGRHSSNCTVKRGRGNIRPPSLLRCRRSIFRRLHRWRVRHKERSPPRRRLRRGLLSRSTPVRRHAWKACVAPSADRPGSRGRRSRPSRRCGIPAR